MTARFWTFHNGDWVKLSLRPEQTLATYHYQRDEEGYSSQSVVWTHNGLGVFRETSTRGRDCDGVRSSTFEDYCPMRRLAHVPCVDRTYDGAETPEHDEKGAPMRRPRWTESAPTRCYDQYAEAAGY